MFHTFSLKVTPCPASHQRLYCSCHCSFPLYQRSTSSPGGPEPRWRSAIMQPDGTHGPHDADQSHSHSARKVDVIISVTFISEFWQFGTNGAILTWARTPGQSGSLRYFSSFSEWGCAGLYLAFVSIVVTSWHSHLSQRQYSQTSFWRVCISCRELVTGEEEPGESPALEVLLHDNDQGYFGGVCVWVSALSRARILLHVTSWLQWT